MKERPIPTSIGKPALRALRQNGYFNLNQLASVDESTLLGLHGVGPKAIRILKEELTQNKIKSDLLD